jgi:rhomboid protease GluP
MIIEKKFKENFLTHFRYQKGHWGAIIVIMLCYVLSWMYWSSNQEISTILNANFKSVFINGEYWRLITTSFIHADLEHLLANTAMLIVLTYLVTSYYGILISVVLSFVVGIFINAITILIYGGEVSLVGASGIIYFLWGFSLILYLNISRHLHIIKRSIRVIGIFLILLVPTAYNPSTSYLAHYIGFILGVIIGLIYFYKNKQIIQSFDKWEYYLVEDFEKLNE